MEIDAVKASRGAAPFNCKDWLIEVVPCRYVMCWRTRVETPAVRPGALMND